MPEPLPLRAMLGPSVILAGLSIGSGELVLWPRLVADHGFAIFWAACAGVTLQFFLNLEIERWTLATGESAVTGLLRLGRVWGPVFLVCATVPWVWPGWATGAAEIVTWQLGMAPSDGAALARPLAVAGLLACGLVLTVSPVVYRVLETLQIVLVASIFVLLGGLAVLVVEPADVLALAAGATRLFYVPHDVSLPLFLGALAFAGAGGSVNLAQSNYVKDKGYGMGRYAGRITSPFTGREEAVSEIGVAIEGSAEDLARWRIWWRRANAEHFFSFFVLCLASLALLCLISQALLPPAGAVSKDFGFLADQAATLEQRFGPLARHAFLAAGVAILLSTELALLDAVARVSADVLATEALRRGARWNVSRLYAGFVWGFVAFGALAIGLGLDQPLALLTLSAALNAGVMFLYSSLLLWLNATSFRGALRPTPFRLGALAACVAFYGFFSALTLADQLRRLGAS